MLIFFVKSQLALFDAPIQVAAHVRKDGTVVKPHIRIQKVAVKHKPVARPAAQHVSPQPSLFGGEAEPAAPKPKRSKLEAFIAKRGGAAALAATISGFTEQQQRALLEQMAKVEGVDVAEVRKLLGLGEAAAREGQQEHLENEHDPVETKAGPAEETLDVAPSVKPTRMTDRQIAIVKMHSEKLSQSEIAEALSVSRSTIQREFSRLGLEGVPGGRPAYSEEAASDAMALYQDGLSMLEVERRTGIDDQAIKRILERNNIEIRKENLNPRYDAELKNEALRLYSEGLMSAAVVARRLSLKTHTVKEWASSAGVIRDQSEAAAIAIANGHTRGRSFSRYLWQSSKTGEWNVADSTFEGARMQQLDEDESVEYWSKCADKISYADPVSGVVRTYIPDFFIEYSDGSRMVEEIKPLGLTNTPVNKAKSASAKMFYHDKGVEYVVVTEDDIGNDSIKRFKESGPAEINQQETSRLAAIRQKERRFERLAEETDDDRRTRLDREAANARRRRAEKNASSSNDQVADDGPKDGDRNADGLVFRNGRWHREDEQQPESSRGAASEPVEPEAGSADPEPAAAISETDLAEDREDLATELTRNPHSDKAKAMLAAAADRHAKADAPVSSDEDDPNSPNYRFADTGYIAGSRKEEAAASVIQRAKRDGAQVMVQHIDWEGLEQNPREAKELITKSNLFGVVPWATLRDNGMEPGAGFLVDRIYASIAQEPTDDKPQARKDYTLGLQTLRKRLESCKTTQQVLEVLDEVRDEYTGKVMNAEESAALQKVWDTEKPLALRLREISKAADERYKKMNAKGSDVAALEYKQRKRIDRGWKPDPELAKQIEQLRPEADALRKEWAEHPDREVEKHLRAQIGDLHRLARQIEQASIARNQIENDMYRAWNTMGERFINVLRFRNYNGSEAFSKHVTAAKNGGIKDWSWAEKEGATKAPKVKEESARFQMRVAERYERKGGRQVDAPSTMALKQHFGLRDVQSGNWVLRDPVSAKFHVEHTAAAFADLADLIGIPDEQVSFNGRLAIAFGARGKGNAGWGGAAAAHYEPVHRVINMTKMSGGGSLAHEWFHAVDNLIKEAEGLGGSGVDDWLTENPSILPAGPLRDAFQNLRRAMMDGEHQLTTKMQYTAADYRLAKHNLDRPVLGSLATKIKQAKDVGEAMASIEAYFDSRIGMRGAKKQRASWERIAVAWHGGNPDGGEIHATHGPKMSSFMKEAHFLDGGSKKSYYSEGKEMAARAFQSWVEDRMAGMGRKNDYLSCYADNKYHVDPLFGIEWKPFPEGEERERINAAFDNLMAVLGEQQVLAKALNILEKIAV